MLIQFFQQYLRAKGLAERTIGHYVTGINTINTLLEKYEFPIRNVFAARDKTELDCIANFLNTNKEFVTKNTVGHNMYSVSFHHFCDFAYADHDFFETHIEDMDIVVNKPKIITTAQSTWKRNQILIAHSIEGANYMCEHNHTHTTFISKATGKAYMEGHHLIPLRFQEHFDNSLDIYANIVSLCPICHRLLHHGMNFEKEHVAEKLYEERYDRLCKSGIDISRKEFIKLII